MRQRVVDIGKYIEIAVKRKEHFTMKHFLKLLDCSKEEILELLDLADQLKKENKQGIEHHILKGKTWV